MESRCWLMIDVRDMPELPLEPLPETPLPRCPVCGAETDTFCRGKHMDIVGCDECVRAVDAWELTE